MNLIYFSNLLYNYSSNYSKYLFKSPTSSFKNFNSKLKKYLLLTSFRK